MNIYIFFYDTNVELRIKYLDSGKEQNCLQ